MWFDDHIHGANTDEDPSIPEKTRRVIVIIIIITLLLLLIGVFPIMGFLVTYHWIV